MEDTSVRQKIILAVIDCIEKEGIQNLTTRSIAQEAGVNIAAINYYFRSKEKLVEETFDQIGKHFITDLEEMLSSKDIKKVIEEPLAYIFQGCIKFPNILRAVLYEPFLNNNYEGIFVKGLNNIIEKLCERLEAKKDDSRISAVKLILLQFMSTALFLGMFPGFFNGSASIDLRSKELQEEYIRYVSDQIARGL